MTDPESVRCPSCGSTSGTPCTGVDQMITVDGVTRRAVHADRRAASLPPEERVAFWERLIDEFYAEQEASDAVTEGDDR